jgi:restriction system protein
LLLPPERNIRLPLLKVLDESGGQLSIHDAISRVTENYFPDLTDEAKASRLDSGQLRWQNRVEWARFKLIQSGELDGSLRGVWRITLKGKEKLQAEWSSWKPQYVEFRARDTAERTKTEEIQDLIENPHEEIEEAHKELVEQTATELLSRIMEMRPESFEILIGELLSKMGYGSIKVTGRSGDQGIDGTCSIDRLGLYRVLFQAKRWQQQVPSKEIRDFVGAMQMARVQNGIFVTTSGFSKDALEAAQKSGKLRLVDGDELARLLIEYDLGVVSKPLNLPKISEDFFSSLA